MITVSFLFTFLDTLAGVMGEVASTCKTVKLPLFPSLDLCTCSCLVLLSHAINEFLLSCQCGNNFTNKYVYVFLGSFVVVVLAAQEGFMNGGGKEKKTTTRTQVKTWQQ